MCFFVFKKKNWTMYLFYNGIKIKKIKINDKSDLDTRYIIVVGHKKLFGKWIVGLMVKPTKLLKTDEEKKTTYWGVVFEKGVDF